MPDRADADGLADAAKAGFAHAPTDPARRTHPPAAPSQCRGAAQPPRLSAARAAGVVGDGGRAERTLLRLHGDLVQRPWLGHPLRESALLPPRHQPCHGAPLPQKGKKPLDPFFV